jgi:hypothetical protein
VAGIWTVSPVFELRPTRGEPQRTRKLQNLRKYKGNHPVIAGGFYTVMWHLHSGIVVVAAESSSRRRHQHRSTQSRLKKRFAHQRVPQNGTQLSPQLLGKTTHRHIHNVQHDKPPNVLPLL